ncbi:transcription initiation factor TFIID subunit 8 [Diospyros lotus]|uniref:transcription initiation factor TFIID subunit 8 n=1 Tax=Diospyros lotus TaxID=55363 RepID=UPI0022557B7D|nr:transcription initiation factor TFIID subunit 8 [Diospyros lotus]
MKSQTLTMRKEEEEAEADASQPEFASAITRVAVAQICQSVGFKATQSSALRTLTDVAGRYLRALGEYATASAASSGRTQSNLFDIALAIEHLSSVQGFPGASVVNRPLVASSTLSDLAEFVKYTDEIPFAKPIPRCRPPVNAPRGPPDPANSRPLPPHIPSWLPPIPDIGTDETAIINSKENLELETSITTVTGKVDETKRWELPEKRGRVRFRMGLGAGSERFGVGTRSGVCRGGKSVSPCQTSISSSTTTTTIDAEGRDHSNKKKSTAIVVHQ